MVKVESGSEIRVVVRQGRVPAFQPTPQDPESGIRAFLENDSQETLKAGAHRLIAHPASHPHHPTAPHLIHWVAEDLGSNLVIPWTDVSWEKVAKDDSFLSAVERHVREIQQNGSPDKFFFLIGFLPNNTNGHDPNSTLINAGIQSQWRMHIHQVPAVSPDDPFDRFLCPASSPKDRLLASLFLNAGGERAIQSYPYLLTEFGVRDVFTQKVGYNHTQTIERTIFVFRSLQEALIQSLTLQAKAQLDWMTKALTITSEEVISPIFPHTILRYVQFAIPGFLVIFPSYQDKIAGQVKAKGNVWILPFANHGGQSMLSPGGVVLENKRG